MFRAKISTIKYFIILWQVCSGQHGATTIPQQTVQSNVGFNIQNANQNSDFNSQKQQNVKQTVTQQQSFNLQQLANIPMQTFNVQQGPDFQLQGNSQTANFQPVNQANNLQQVPQHFNLQQEVPVSTQQITPHYANLQQATVVPFNSQQSLNINAAPQCVTQQPLPTQGHKLQQAYSANVQPLSQIQAANYQQNSPQSISLQQPVVVQPGNLQQQIVPQSNTVQQSALPVTNMQNQAAQPGNLQQIAQPSVHSQQPSILHLPVTYQQPVLQNDLISATQSNLQQSQNLQKMPQQQLDFQQQLPCSNVGSYQVISYQKPCQQAEVAPALATTLPLSTLSSSSNPAVIAAVPSTIPNANTQTTDHIYFLSPQNYLTPTSYAPIVLSDNLQPSLPGATVVPIMTFPNAVPTTTTNYPTSNRNQQFEIENWTTSLRMPDYGTLSTLQEQFPISSLLNQPTSSIQSALLSSILSSIHPASPPQYIISSSYPAQTILSPQCSSQSSKLSLKSLLPLLLNLVQEKYTNCGCQCQCCNCDCCRNQNIMPEPQLITELPTELGEKNTEYASLQNDQSTEIEDIPVHPRQRKKPNNNQNMISDDSKEIDDAENSSCEDEDDDPVDDSDDDANNDSQ